MSSAKNTSTLHRILFIFIFHLLIIASFAQQKTNNRERIIRFHSDIIIDSTGRVQVTEHIKVYANGSSIKRGIVRRIPVNREDISGKKVKVGIKVLAVLRDGKAEDYHEEIINGLHVIYMGNKNHILSPGKYEYAITYESYGHIGFFDDYDELYWNVTGNDWDFTIESASATIKLPGDAHSISTACYTGLIGSTKKDCVSLPKDNIVLFESKSSLAESEGLTVAVSFPRDIVKRPPPPSKAELLFLKYRKVGCIAISLIILGLFYFITWIRVGKDPEKPVVIPTFNPPNGWSPAIVRYLYKKKYDEKTFTAAILSMAVKRSLVISKNKKKYSLARTNNKTRLTKEELTVHTSLFSSYSELTVSDKYHTTFSSAFSKLRSYLTTQWNIKEYFKKNGVYAFFAAILTIGAIVLYGYYAVPEKIFVFATNVAIILAALYIIDLGLKTKNIISKIVVLLLGIYCAYTFLTSDLVWIFTDDPVTGLFIIVLLAGFFLYVYLIKAPTELGARTQADLEGFKMYLETAEENRLNLLMAPELTPQLFEEMLPYAVALDVENKWSEKFNEVLSQYNYSPEWYDGDLSKFTYVSFASSLSSSFTSSFSSAKVDPSSSSSSSSGSSSWSSGSSGGGSSGGGGGGGGGGGW